MPLCCSCSDCPSKPCSERLPTNFCGCAASLQIEPMMDSMSAAVISSLLIFRTMSSAPQPACRMPKKRNSSDQRDDRDSGDLVASLNRHPGQRWSPRGFFAFLPWLVLHSDSAQEVSVTFRHTFLHRAACFQVPLSESTTRMKPIRVASACDVTVSSCAHPLLPCVVRRHRTAVGCVLKRRVGRARREFAACAM